MIFTIYPRGIKTLESRFFNGRLTLDSGQNRPAGTSPAFVQYHGWLECIAHGLAHTTFLPPVRLDRSDLDCRRDHHLAPNPISYQVPK